MINNVTQPERAPGAPPRPRWKPVLAWIGVGFGLLAVAASFSQPGGAGAVVGMILFGLAIAAPGAWWLWCDHADQKIAAENHDLAVSYGQMSQHLLPEDAPYSAALGEVPQKPAVNRRWKLVAPASVAALVAGAILTPPTAEENAPARIVSPPPVTSTAPASTEPAPATTTSSEAPPPSSESFTTVAPPAAPVEPTSEPAPVPLYAPPPAAPEPTRAAPAPAPAPAVGGGGSYFRNCAEARAAGAAPLYQGSPGYRPGLDRDGDGIACE